MHMISIFETINTDPWQHHADIKRFKNSIRFFEDYDIKAYPHDTIVVSDSPLCHM